MNNSLQNIVEHARTYTNRPGLQWDIRGGVFTLGDDTRWGNLALGLISPIGGLREVYLKPRHFGLTREDLATIEKALLLDRALPVEQLEVDLAQMFREGESVPSIKEWVKDNCPSLQGLELEILLHRALTLEAKEGVLRGAVL